MHIPIVEYVKIDVFHYNKLGAWCLVSNMNFFSLYHVLEPLQLSFNYKWSYALMVYGTNGIMFCTGDCMLVLLHKSCRHIEVKLWKFLDLHHRVSSKFMVSAVQYLGILSSNYYFILPYNYFTLQ